MRLTHTSFKRNSSIKFSIIFSLAKKILPVGDTFDIVSLPNSPLVSSRNVTLRHYVGSQTLELDYVWVMERTIYATDC